MIKIYHNSKCGTSRKLLAILQAQGVEIEIIEYLKTPLTQVMLARLARKMDKSARALLREKEALCDQLGLKKPTQSEDGLLQAIAKHPILLNRPIIETTQKALVCRPADLVYDFLKTYLAR